MKPDVSIILPTYNGASRGYLATAIESVLSQTQQSIELVIIDDGSSDATRKLCSRYLSHPIVTYYFQKNKGLSAARNAGIKRSKGEYLLFLDDDDIYQSCLVETMLRSFIQNNDPKIGMLYCSYLFIDEKGKAFGKWYIPAEGNIYERLFYDNYAGSPSGTMIHRSVIEKVGLFNETLRSCEDYDMWLRIAKHFHVYSIEEPLLLYRIHSNNMSGNIHKIETYQKKVLDIALADSPQNIQSNKNAYYHHLYREFAAKYFEVHDFDNFRRCIKIAMGHGKITRGWQLKYWLSRLPRFTKRLVQIKRKLTSSVNA